MLRLIGFFVAILAVMQLLRHVPGLSFVFSGLWGFWLTALIVSGVGTWATNRAVVSRRLERQRRALEAVDSAHHQGKLGSLLVASGRARAAVAPLEHAVASEPDSPEWRYQLGRALLRAGRAREAIDALAATARIDEEYAYGEVQLRLAEAHTRLGDAQRALGALDCFERNHGPSPESAYRRGVALRKLGRRAEARESFAHVGTLAARAVQFQRARNRGFVLRAFFARFA